jgi:hypothetical protein
LICTSGTLMNRKIDLFGAQQQMHIQHKCEERWYLIN